MSMFNSDEFAGDHNSDEFAGKHAAQRSPFMLRNKAKKAEASADADASMNRPTIHSKKSYASDEGKAKKKPETRKTADAVAPSNEGARAQSQKARNPRKKRRIESSPESVDSSEESSDDSSDTVSSTSESSNTSDSSSHKKKKKKGLREALRAALKSDDDDEDSSAGEDDFLGNLESRAKFLQAKRLARFTPKKVGRAFAELEAVVLRGPHNPHDENALAYAKHELRTWVRYLPKIAKSTKKKAKLLKPSVYYVLQTLVKLRFPTNGAKAVEAFRKRAVDFDHFKAFAKTLHDKELLKAPSTTKNGRRRIWQKGRHPKTN
jgi:hypothetical protein